MNNTLNKSKTVTKDKVKEVRARSERKNEAEELKIVVIVTVAQERHLPCIKIIHDDISSRQIKQFAHAFKVQFYIFNNIIRQSNKM